MSIIRDSCVFFYRAALITLNLIIYFILYALLGNMPEQKPNQFEEQYEKMVHVEDIIDI